MSELRIIDADGHVREDIDAIAEYLELPFGRRKFFFPLWPGDGRFRGARISSTPAKLWQDYVDAVGIRFAVLYPTLGLSHGLIQEADWACTLAIHGSPQSGLGLEVFERHIEAHVLSHPLPIAMHCIGIVFGGVIESFPKIRIAFLEAGSSWVPFLMERMDFELERLKPSFEWRPAAAPPIAKRPSKYFTQGNIYVGCEAAERTLPFVAQWLGADHIVFPTDFPHSFTFERFVEEVKGFVERKDLPPS